LAYRSGIETTKGGKYEEKHAIEWEKYALITQKVANNGGIPP
jgi:hypothetical protein